MAALDELYKEVILDHYKNPRNKRGLDDATVSRRKNNPLCGDEIEIHALLSDGEVKEVTFEGQGCSISQASASMLTESVRGKPLGEAGTLVADFRGMMEGRVDPDEDAFGQVSRPHQVRRAGLGHPPGSPRRRRGRGRLRAHGRRPPASIALRCPGGRAAHP